MMMELDVVFWDDQVEALLWLLDLYQFQDLHVILVDFTGECEWTHVDHVNVGIFHGEDAHDLSIFLLLQLLDGHPLYFTS